MRRKNKTIPTDLYCEHCKITTTAYINFGFHKEPYEFPWICENCRGKNLYIYKHPVVEMRERIERLGELINADKQETES